jgi:hypothetical protein
MATVETVVASALELSVEDRLQVLHQLTASLLGASAAVAAIPKAASGKKAKSPDAPKRELTWWIKATMEVRKILKTTGDELEVTTPPRVASMLKGAGQLADGLFPSDEEVLAMYEEYKANPPAPKSSSSTASKGSSTGSAKTKFSDLSEEEKKARRSEAGKKAAATRAANKAAREAEVDGGATPKPAKPAIIRKPAGPTKTDEETTDGREIWVIGGKRYARAEDFLWDAKTLKWAGALNKDGSIDTEAEEMEYNTEEAEEVAEE